MCHGTHKWFQQNMNGNKTMKYPRDVLKLLETDSLGFSGLAWTRKK
jgi:hypothetical protein